MANPTTVDSLAVSSANQTRRKTLWRPLVPWRLPLWFAFLGFTASLLTYPVDLKLGSLSPEIIPNLHLFGAMFYLWAAALVVLLFTPSDEGTARWERLALVVIAALVFRGFWGIIVPIQGQAYVHVTATKVWQGLGHVVRHPAAGYIEWPGVSLAISVLSQIAGLELIPSVAILTVLIAIVIGIASYVFLLGVLKSSLSASLASLLIIAGNLAMIIYLTAGPTTIVFVVLFLAILFQEGGLRSSSRILVALLLLTAATVTHFHSAMHFFFILLGLWAPAMLRWRQAEPGLPINTVTLFPIIPVAWIMFWGLSAFIWVSWGSRALFADPISVWERLAGVFTAAQSNFGESAPRWYSLTRLLWLVLLYAVGGLIWLWSLVKFRRLGPTETRLAAGLSGLVLMNVLGSLVSPRGFGELLRGLTYAPFFTAPFLLLFLHQLKARVRKAALLGLAAVLFALSLPTFLAADLRISILTPYQTEYSVGEWLQSIYGTGRGLNVFLTHPIFGTTLFYLLDATYLTDREAESSGYTRESRWQAMDELLVQFERSSQGGKSGLFIHSPRMAVVTWMNFGIPVDHPRWGEMTDWLSRRSNGVYHNGPIRIYASRAGFSRDAPR